MKKNILFLLVACFFMSTSCLGQAQKGVKITTTTRVQKKSTASSVIVGINDCYGYFDGEDADGYNVYIVLAYQNGRVVWKEGQIERVWISEEMNMSYSNGVLTASLTEPSSDDDTFSLRNVKFVLNHVAKGKMKGYYECDGEDHNTGRKIRVKKNVSLKRIKNN